MKFTLAQLAAVDVSDLGQDKCVVAGPGSGKTTVLVERFRNLVGSGVRAHRILAITFTEKAAAQIKEKIGRTFAGDTTVRHDLECAYISTVHGFCARLLRENAIAAGIDPEFRVSNEREAEAQRRLAAADALDRLYFEDPGRMRSLLFALEGFDLTGAMIDIYDAMRASGVTSPAPPALPGRATFADLLDAIAALPALPAAAAVKEWAGRFAHLRARPACREQLAALSAFECKLTGIKRNTPLYAALRHIKKEMVEESVPRTIVTELYGPERATICEALARFDRLYRERKTQSGVLDYADLEEFAVRLLEEHEDVRRRVREQFDQVIMDEFQDTNGVQWRLVQLVCPPDRFYAVGDINQSIYGFRHADPAIFREYRERVRAAGKPLVELIENFRSRQEILDTATVVLDGRAGIEPRRLSAAREFQDKQVPSVEVLGCFNADRDAACRLEARWVARRVRELQGALPLRQGTADFRDFAVLVRNSETMQWLGEAFEEFGVPYLVSRGKGFYEAPEVADLTHLLRVLLNARDEISMAAVLHSPLAGVSAEALFQLKTISGSGNLGSALRGVADAGAVFDAQDRERLLAFQARFELWRELRDSLSFDRILLDAIDRSGYRFEAGTREASNIEKFLDMARQAAARMTLAEFVQELEFARVNEPREPEAPPEDSANAVKVMTVHAAKGLEFPVVFLSGLHKGVDTSAGKLIFSPQRGLGVNWREKSDWYHKQIREERAAREAEEANRLFYVAMTRAAEHLVFSFACWEKLTHWAAVLSEGTRLDLEAATNRERVESILGPEGRMVAVRVLCTDTPPEALESAPAGAGTSGAIELAPPPLSAQHDGSAGVTSVSLFAMCPRKYFLARYLGYEGRPPRRIADDSEEPDAAGSDLDASGFGRQVHELLAGAAVDSPAPQALELAEAFRRSDLGRRAAAARSAQCEYDFLMELEDVVLRGQIDLFFEHGRDLILVDYKTDDVDAASAPYRAREYEVQLQLYALAVERIAGRLPTRAYICMLRPEVTVEVPLAPLFLDAAVKTVRRFRQAQSALEFPAEVGAHCKQCVFHGGQCTAGWQAGR